MKPGGGKRKGGSMERQISKALSLWITNGKKEDVLWRSALSGGRATVAHKRGSSLGHSAGDISAIAPEGHVLTDSYYLELKHYKKLSLDCLLKGKGPLLDIWKNTVKEASKYNKIPVLIYKQNNYPIMWVTTDLGVTDMQAKALVMLEASNMYFVDFNALLARPFPLGK